MKLILKSVVFSKVQYFFFRDCYKRSKQLFMSDTDLRLSDGFYAGYDLIPQVYTSNNQLKECKCGVSITIIITILTFLFDLQKQLTL